MSSCLKRQFPVETLGLDTELRFQVGRGTITSCTTVVIFRTKKLRSFLSLFRATPAACGGSQAGG